MIDATLKELVIGDFIVFVGLSRKLFLYIGETNGGKPRNLSVWTNDSGELKISKSYSNNPEHLIKLTPKEAREFEARVLVRYDEEDHHRFKNYDDLNKIRKNLSKYLVD